MNKIFFAKLISYLLGPEVWYPILLSSMVLKSGLSRGEIIQLLPSLITFQFVIPIVYFYILLRLKKISDWDISSRKERYRLIPLVTITWLISLFLAFKLGNSFIFNLLLINYVLIIVVELITYFWKISYHLCLATACSILINFLFGWEFWWLYLTIPLAFWARLTLKKHTVSQMLGGILVSLVVTIGGLIFFGYLRI